MLPHMIILIIAIVGACINGPLGFIQWGIAGYIGIIILGYLLGLLSGGLIPRKLKNKTAADFIYAHGDIVKNAYPNHSYDGCKERIAAALEDIAKRAAATNPVSNQAYALSREHFLETLSEIVSEQERMEVKILLSALGEFIEFHPEWYGSDLPRRTTCAK